MPVVSLFFNQHQQHHTSAKKTCKKQHLVDLGGVLVCCAYP
jgi:hypothetical protein